MKKFTPIIFLFAILVLFSIFYINKNALIAWGQGGTSSCPSGYNDCVGPGGTGCCGAGYPVYCGTYSCQSGYTCSVGTGGSCCPSSSPLLCGGGCYPSDYTCTNGVAIPPGFNYCTGPSGAGYCGIGYSVFCGTYSCKAGDTCAGGGCCPTEAPLACGGFCYPSDYTCSGGVATPPPTPCLETDPSHSHQIKGTVTQGTLSFTDYCLDNNMVMEYTCAATPGAGISGGSFNCSNLGSNYGCSNGVCVFVSTPDSCQQRSCSTAQYLGNLTPSQPLSSNVCYGPGGPYNRYFYFYAANSGTAKINISGPGSGCSSFLNISNGLDNPSMENREGMGCGTNLLLKSYSNCNNETKYSVSAGKYYYFEVDPSYYTQSGSYIIPKPYDPNFVPPAITVSLDPIITLPTLVFSASPASIKQNESSLLSWKATDASSCTASGDWSGARLASGLQYVTPLLTSTYALACSGPGGTVSKSVTVAVTTASIISCSTTACQVDKFKLTNPGCTTATGVNCYQPGNPPGGSCYYSNFQDCPNGCFNGECKPPSLTVKTGKGVQNLDTGVSINIFGADLGAETANATTKLWGPGKIDIWSPIDSFDLSTISPWQESVLGLFEIKNTPLGGGGDLTLTNEFHRLDNGQDYLIAKGSKTFKDPGVGYYYPRLTYGVFIGYLPSEISKNSGPSTSYYVKGILSGGGLTSPLTTTKTFAVSGISPEIEQALLPMTLSISPTTVDSGQNFNIKATGAGDTGKDHNVGVSSLSFGSWSGTGWEEKSRCYCSGVVAAGQLYNYAPACEKVYNQVKPIVKEGPVEINGQIYDGQWYGAVCYNNWQNSESFFGGQAKEYQYNAKVIDAEGISHQTAPPSVAVSVNPLPDTAPPTGTIIASPSSVSLGQPVAITMTGSDDTSLDWLTWSDAYSNGSQWHSCGGIGTLNCSYSWTFTPTAPGDYTFTGMIWDHYNHSTIVTSNPIAVAPCSGSVSLSLSPSTAMRGGAFQLAASGLSNCQGKKISFKDSSMIQGVCTVGSDGAGCAGPQLLAPLTDGSYPYYANIDINGNGSGNDAGEWASADLKVVFGVCFSGLGSLVGCESSCGNPAASNNCRNNQYITGYCSQNSYNIGWCSGPLDTACLCAAKDDPSNYLTCGQPGADIGFMSPVIGTYPAGLQSFSLGPYALDANDKGVSGDQGAVRYWYHTTTGNQQFDKIDDKLSGQCNAGLLPCALAGQSNLELQNSWTFASPDKLTVSTKVSRYCAGHAFDVGFFFNTPVKYDISGVGACLTGGRKVTAASSVGGSGGSYATDITLNYCGDGKITCGEQCDGQPGCGGNCQWADKTLPVTNIKIYQGTADITGSIDTTWLTDKLANQGSYIIKFEDSDEAGGSGLNQNKCQYSIDKRLPNGSYVSVLSPTTRSCGGQDVLRVGPSDDCSIEGNGACRITSLVEDNAGNPSVKKELLLNVDYTPPTAK